MPHTSWQYTHPGNTHIPSIHTSSQYTHPLNTHILSMHTSCNLSISLIYSILPIHHSLAPPLHSPLTPSLTPLSSVTSLPCHQWHAPHCRARHRYRPTGHGPHRLPRYKRRHCLPAVTQRIITQSVDTQ